MGTRPMIGRKTQLHPLRLPALQLRPCPSKAVEHVSSLRALHRCAVLQDSYIAMVVLDCQVFAQGSAFAMTGRLRPVKSGQRYNDHHRVIFHPSSTVCSAGPQHSWRLSRRLNPAGVASLCAAAYFAFVVGLQCMHG